LLAEHLLELPTSINEALRTFQKIHKIVLEVAEKETALRKLLYEIERTKRKSNAIENILIPKLLSAVKFITFRLDEMERDTFIMLKTVKRKMGEREEMIRKKEEIKFMYNNYNNNKNNNRNNNTKGNFANDKQKNFISLEEPLRLEISSGQQFCYSL
jgi:hypothetical protein